MNTYANRNDFHKSWLSYLLHVAWEATGILYWERWEKCVCLDLVQLAAAEDSWWDFFWYVGFIGAQRSSCKNWPWWLWAVTARIFLDGLAWEVSTFWNPSWVWRPLQETGEKSFQTQQMDLKQLLRVATGWTGVWLAPYQLCMATCFIALSDVVCESSTRAFIHALAVNLAVKLL